MPLAQAHINCRNKKKQRKNNSFKIAFYFHITQVPHFSLISLKWTEKYFRLNRTYLGVMQDQLIEIFDLVKK